MAGARGWFFVRPVERELSGSNVSLRWMSGNVVLSKREGIFKRRKERRRRAGQGEPRLALRASWTMYVDET